MEVSKLYILYRNVWKVHCNCSKLIHDHVFMFNQYGASQPYSVFRNEIIINILDKDFNNNISYKKRITPFNPYSLTCARFI